MNYELEIWKDVHGYNGLYVISSFGRIKTLSKKVRYRNGSFAQRSESLLKPFLNRDGGYLKVRLRKDGKDTDIYVHRLVLIAFVPNAENKPQVNHIDGNKINNRLENLEWNTISENITHSIRTGLNNSAKLKRGMINESHPRSRPIRQIDCLTGKVIKEWPSISETRRQGFAPGGIVNVLKGRAYASYGYLWKYK